MPSKARKEGGSKPREPEKGRSGCPIEGDLGQTVASR